MTQQADPPTETPLLLPAGADVSADLRLRAETAERKLAALQNETRTKLIRAELKAEAIRAGIVDLDGLKLIDLTGVQLDSQGEVEGAPALMAQLKRAKPWLFSSISSSPAVSPPPAQPPRPKLATEMTDAEYLAARAALLKRRV
jgi:hypothetical protein